MHLRTVPGIQYLASGHSVGRRTVALGRAHSTNGGPFRHRLPTARINPVLLAMHYVLLKRRTCMRRVKQLPSFLANVVDLTHLRQYEPSLQVHELVIQRTHLFRRCKIIVIRDTIREYPLPASPACVPPRRLARLVSNAVVTSITSGATGCAIG
jgi:hypothetical protein